MSTELSTEEKRTIEFIKVQLESLKHQYDYFKNMTTLNTGAFILVVAFMERAFENPVWKEVILVSLVCFSVSLFFSLLVMKSYITSMEKMWGWNFPIEGRPTGKEIESLKTKLKNQIKWCGVFFFLGIFFLLVFAGANILFLSLIHI